MFSEKVDLAMPIGSIGNNYRKIMIFMLPNIYAPQWMEKVFLERFFGTQKMFLSVILCILILAYWYAFLLSPIWIHSNLHTKWHLQMEILRFHLTVVHITGLLRGSRSKSHTFSQVWWRNGCACYRNPLFLLLWYLLALGEWILSVYPVQMFCNCGHCHAIPVVPCYKASHPSSTSTALVSASHGVW